MRIGVAKQMRGSIDANARWKPGAATTRYRMDKAVRVGDAHAVESPARVGSTVRREGVLSIPLTEPLSPAIADRLPRSRLGSGDSRRAGL